MMDLSPRLSYDEAVRWIYDLSLRERTGMRLGLESITGLCERVGDPQDHFTSLHVAGTNGKGSVAHIIESVLREEQDITGLYTSPHLQTFCERVRVKGRMIAEHEIVGIAQELFPHVEAMGFGPTFFDVTTALAFMHFRDKGVHRAVVEVGLGGRLDSTNVLRKVEVCVLTNLSLDHTDVLGDDVGSIAMEKASIFKEGARVVLGDIPSEAVPVIEELAKRKGAADIRGPARVEVMEEDLHGMILRVQGTLNEYDVKIGLLGRHQARNVAVAVSALEALVVPPTKAVMEAGLSKARVPGRMEVVNREPLVIIDGAHNPAAGAALGRALKDLVSGREVVLVLGLMKDKDIPGFLDQVSVAVSAVVATRADTARAARPEDIIRHAEGKCRQVTMGDDVKEAMEKARDLAGDDGVIVATGSFYIAGEVRQLFMPVHHPL